MAGSAGRAPKVCLDQLGGLESLGGDLAAAQLLQALADQRQLGALGIAQPDRAAGLDRDFDRERVALVPQAAELLGGETLGAIDPGQLAAIGAALGCERLALRGQRGEAGVAPGDPPLHGVKALLERRGLFLAGEPALQLGAPLDQLEGRLRLEALAGGDLDRGELASRRSAPARSSWAASSISRVPGPSSGSVSSEAATP